MDKAFDKIAATLAEGEIVCLFPEGKITYDGKVNAFRPGIEKIIQRSPVPVIPMSLHGLWGSFFSRKHGAAGTKYSVILQRIWSQVELKISEPWAPQVATAQSLESKIKKMLGEE